MAFKRYIKKHGRKLGPYYYENVRDRHGKVKSIYLGSNPSNHPKHKIRKPLFFLILALVLILALGGSLFLFQNKAYVVNKVHHEEPDFEVDQILLKVLVRQNEFIEKQLRVTNIGDGPSSLSVEVHGLSDLVGIDSKAFNIKPGQTKILALNFSSFIGAENIEQQPGVYIGKLAVRSEKAEKEIPVIVEIETKNILFDMNLNPVAIERKVKQGTDTTIEVRLFNLESIESQNVDVEYVVKDMNGNTIVSESETVVVKAQASFFKTISIPKNLKPGPYIFAGLSKFGNSVGTSSYLFEVVGPEEASFVQFCRNSILCLGLSISTLLLLFALMAYFYFFVGAYLYDKITGIAAVPRKKREEKEPERTLPQAAEEIEEPGAFEKIKIKFAVWQKKRRIKQAQHERKERQKELDMLAETRGAELEAERKRKEIEKRALEELRRGQELVRQKEAERKRKLDLGKLRAAEREKLWNERKKNVKKILHQFGLYKTPEEKRQKELEGLRAEEGREKREEELKKQKQLEEQEEVRKKEDESLRKLREQEEKQRLEEEKRDEEIRKQKELEKRQKEEEIKQKQIEAEKSRQEELKRKEEIRKQKEQECIRLEEEKKKKKLERAKKIRAAKKQAREFLHRIGLYKTPEEKKQIALQKEIQRKEKGRKKLGEMRLREQEERRKELEKQKAEEEGRKEEEAEKKIKESEKRQKHIEEEKARQEELERKDEERKKIELEKKQKEQERIRLEEEKGQKVEEEKKKKELERQSKEKLRQEKLAAIKSLESKLIVNEEEQNKLKNQIKNLENEVKKQPEKTRELEGSVGNLDSQINQKSQQYSELEQKNASISEDLKRKTLELEEKDQQEKNARDAKINELRQKLADKQTSLMQEMEQALAKLSPAKRKAAEKWKKLELKAKLKIEEHNIQGEIAKHKGKFEDEAARLKEDSKKALNGISSSQRQLKKEIGDLNRQKEQILKEKDGISSEIEGKKSKVQETKSRIHDLLISHDEIKSNLRKAKSELGLFGFGLFSILPKKEKIEEPERREKEPEKLSEEEKLKGIESRLKAREEKRKAREEQKRLKQEEKLKAKEEKKRQKEIEKELEKQIPTEKPKEKKESWREKIFGKKTIKEPDKSGKKIKKEERNAKALIDELLEEEPKEKLQSKEAEFKIDKPKSRKLQKCYKTIDSARKSISRNKINDTKKLYLEARNLYLGLEYNEKKEVYDELMDLYSRLIR